MAYIECDLDHKVPSIYDTLDIESKNTLDMTYIKGYSFPVCTHIKYVSFSQYKYSIAHSS